MGEHAGTRIAQNKMTANTLSLNLYILILSIIVSRIKNLYFLTCTLLYVVVLLSADAVYFRACRFARGTENENFDPVSDDSIAVIVFHALKRSLDHRLSELAYRAAVNTYQMVVMRHAGHCIPGCS